MYEFEALVFAGIGAVAAAFGLIFNGWTNLQQTKSNYFQVFRDLEEEYNTIDKRSLPLKDHILMDDENLKKQSPDIYNNTTQFKRDYVEFHEKIAHLYYTKVIPKNIPEYFALGFAISLFYVDTSKRKDEIKKQVNNLIKWCQKQEIGKKPPYEKNPCIRME